MNLAEAVEAVGNWEGEEGNTTLSLYSCRPEVKSLFKVYPRLEKGLYFWAARVIVL